ncbi:MAG: ABC transporter substrate binding protein [Victivallaceae bacterium]|nr:ABC transporter substrate binding protein [Victivallaceae bacterium]
MGGLVRKIVRFAVFVVCLCCFAAGAGEKKESKTILLVHSGSCAESRLFDLSGSFLRTIQLSGIPAAVHQLELNASASEDGVASQKKLDGYLSALRQHRYNVIAVIGDEALQLLLRNADNFPQDIPIVFFGVRQWDSSMAARHPLITGNCYRDPIRRNIDFALQVFPGLKRLVILTDNTAEGRITQRELTHARGLPRGISVTILRGEEISSDSMIRRIRSFGPGTVAIFSSWNERSFTRIEERQEALSELCVKAGVPVIVERDAYIQFGVIGGVVIHGEQHGLDAAERIIMLLNNRKITALPVSRIINTPVVNWRMVRYFNIDPDGLPNGSELLGKPSDYWVLYRSEILIGGISLFLLLGVLVVALGLYLYLKRNRWRDFELFRKLPIRFGVVDPDGNILRDKAGEGISTNPARSIRDIPGIDIKVLLHLIRKVAKTGERATLDYEWDGELRTAFFSPLAENLYDGPAVLWVSQETGEIQRSRRAASDSAEKLLQTIHAIGDAVIVTDAEEGITLMNDSAARLTGWSKHEAYGRKLEEVFQICDANTAEPIVSPTRRAIREGRRTDLPAPVRLSSRTGTNCLIADCASPVRTEHGAILGAVMIFRDVSGDYAKRKRLHEQNLQLRNASDIARIGYFSCNSDGRILSVSPHLPGTFWGRGADGNFCAWEDWVYPEDRAAFGAAWKEIASSDSEQPREIRYRAESEGKIRHYVMRICASVPPMGGARVYFCVLRDVTDEILDRMQRDDLRIFLEAIMDNLPCHVFVKDVEKDFRYLMCNRECVEFFARPPGEIIGKNDFEICRDEESARRCRADDEKTLQSPDGTNTAISEYRLADGTVRQSKLFEKVVVRADGRRVLLGLRADISDLEETQRKLSVALADSRSAERAKSYFLGTMSHEMRTPLNTIIGMSELLENSGFDARERGEYIRAIKFSGNALLNLIDDVLDLSRMEAQGYLGKPEKADLGMVLDEIRTIYQELVEERKLLLDIVFRNRIALLWIDRARIRQILFNLVGNAINISPAGGLIQINVEFHADSKQSESLLGTLVISVSDQGEALGEEERNLMFSPFTQCTSDEDASGYKNSGLGLAIARQMAGRIGGALVSESAPKGGNVLRLTLHNVRYESRPGEGENVSETDEQRLAEGGGCTVLLVDDVAANRMVLRTMLRKLGYETLVASSANEALTLMNTGHVDVVLTDLWMPGISGGELAATIRGDSRMAAVKVVAVTADAEVNANFDVRLFDHVLLKPVTLAKLRELFNRIRGGMQG